jgi:2-polyprenyl-3-methyl-5-hydroxy-6-metoxy-1,4-benzoquinol methylase
MEPGFSPYLDKQNKWSSHSQIVFYLASFPKGTRVLDIGTATGTIGRMGRDLGLRLTGIEPNPEWANRARPFYEAVEIGTIETCPDEFLRDNQVIILADVLEHMLDPEQSLKYLMNLQSGKPWLVISVPNIANIYVRLSLLLGKFNYTDQGILDKTHLRFFTRKTIIEMLGKLNLDVEKIWPTPIPLEKVSPFFENSILGRLIYHLLKVATDIFPTLLGYQFVIIAGKGNP